MMRNSYKIAAFVSLLVCLPTVGDAWLIQGSNDTGKVLLMSSSQGNVSTTLDRYIGLGYSVSAQASIAKQFMFPIAGTIKTLKFTATTQPTGSATYTATVYINGSATSASCAVTASTAICDWSGGVTINAGDYGIILVRPANSPGASSVSAVVGFTPTTPGLSIISSSAITANYSTSSVNYQPGFFYTAPAAATSTLQQYILGDDGTLGDYYVESVAPGTLGSGKSYTYTVYKEGADTAITTSISETATTAHDTSHTASATAGQYLEFKVSPTSTPTASNAVQGVAYQTNTTGGYLFGFNTASTQGTYFSPSNGGTIGSATENNYRVISRSQTFLKIYAKTSGAPGSGKSWTWTLRVNNADTALTCTIADANKTCSGTGTITVNDNDFVSVGLTSAGGPSSVQASGVGLLATR